MQALRNALSVLWYERSRRGKIVVVVVGVFLGLGLIGALASSEDTTTASEETTTSAEVQTTQETETASTASTPQGRAVGSEVDASGWAGTLEVQDVSFEGNEAQIIVTTSRGALKGRAAAMGRRPSS